MAGSRQVKVTGRPIDAGMLKWKRYRKLPVVISATRMNVPFKVETLEGWMEGNAGDWLIEGVEGELYPCKDSVFRATYEEVRDGGKDAG